MSNTFGELPLPKLANLVSLAELDASLDAKGTYDPGNGLYPRDGSDSVTEVEKLISAVTIPDQRLNIVWASGMSAVRETVNFAAGFMADQPRGGDRPKVAYAEELYPQTTIFFQKEKRKGVNIIRFDSGDSDAVVSLIDKQDVDVIFAETIANSPDMPVFDIGLLLSHVRSLDNPPVLILDNTLPLSTGINFSTLLRPEDRVIVVESGTKNLMNNSDLLGISYSKNVELMDGLRKHKAHSGALNSLGALATIAAKLNVTIPNFDKRNRAVFSSTNLIAQALLEAHVELGKDTDYYTTFPTDRNHPNSDLASSLSIEGSEQVFTSPVVFMTALNWSDNGAANLIRRLAQHPAMREQIKAGQIHLGQSFGMASARLLYDRSSPNVRFAGGFELQDEAALASAIKAAAADK